MGPTQRLLEAAAAETLERIRRDRQRVSSQIQPLLAYLEEHLFDPDLDANQLKRACGVRDHSLPVHFHNALDLPPYAYIENCRLQTACRLLRDTNLKVWQIAQLLGYSTLQVFSRAFHRWSGIRPSQYRSKERRRLEEEQAGSGVESSGFKRRRPPVDFTPDDPLIRLETMRRAVNGGLEQTEADTLCRRLCELYPQSFLAASRAAGPGSPPASHDLGGAPLLSPPEDQTLSSSLPTDLLALEQAEQAQAEQAWEELRDRPWDEQWDLVRDRYRFSSAALFHLLRAKSREQGRTDRKRGIRLAELALGSLYWVDEAVGKGILANLHAQGWAWVGNAHRLALDFPAAEKAFIRAEWSLPAGGRDPLVEAELYQNQSALRWFQRRFEEAIELEDRAIPRLRSLNRPELLGQSLILRAAIHYDAGNPKATIPDLREALGLVSEQSQPYLALSAHSNLAVAYALTGEYDQATRALPKARELCEALDNPVTRHKLQWAEGLVHQGRGRLQLAESRFQEARTGFVRLNETDDAAMLSLVLATMYLEQGRSAEVLKLLSEAIPVFESFQIHREVFAALKMLRTAIEANEVSLDVLRKLRASLDEVRRDPAAKLAARESASRALGPSQ